ncbi:MAG: amidoligase family protein [Nanoarchaeota archaeon]
MQKLKFGLEVEGAYLRGKSFKNTKRRLKKEGRKINIVKNYDGTATLGDCHHNRENYKDEIEFKTNIPVKDKGVEIDNHIEDWKILLDELGFVYNPKNCGLHIHFSPIDGNWEDEHFLRFIHNLFYSLLPFIRFFKNRRKQSYCLSNGDYTKIQRFYSEELNYCKTRQDLLERWNNITQSGDTNYAFNRSDIMRLVNREFDTVELRFFPPEPELFQVFMNLIRKTWDKTEKISAGYLTSLGLYDILVLHDMEEELPKFKKYYEEWIK